MSTKWKNVIIGLFFLVISLIVVSFLGCQTASEAYIEANYKNAEVALPDLIEYIENDRELSDLDKEVRKKSVETWWNLIKTSYEDYNK